MLVLSRKKSESIVIDGRITITLVEIRGNQIRLGIDAPAEVRVSRAELLDPNRSPKPLAGIGPDASFL